jgi:hypothetical protein
MKTNDGESPRPESACPFSVEELMEMVAEGVCETVDGCIVEPDGTCEHGSPSWLLALGLI